MTIEEISKLKIPFVGVGRIVHRAGQFLLVRHHDGQWGLPGGQQGLRLCHKVNAFCPNDTLICETSF